MSCTLPLFFRVPAEFMVQNPLHANPPTLFLPLVNLTEWVRQHVARMDMPQGSQQWSAGEFLTAGGAVLHGDLRAW